MVLKDGKFYEGEQVVPLEFGNKIQIDLMEKARAHLFELQNDGVEIEPDLEITWNASVAFKCLYGHTIHESFDGDEDTPDRSILNEMFEDVHKICRGCKREFLFSINDDDKLVYKLISKK
jgi:hypothetical protein